MADPRYRMVSPFDTSLASDPTQDPIVASQYGLINPLEGMSMPSMPALPQGSGNTALNLAGILGGLGLGLARPRVAPQALQTLQAINTIGWREDQKEFARQRLELAQREQALQLANLAEMQRPEGGSASPQFAQASPPPAPPQVSGVPHFALSQPGGAGAAPQFTSESRLEAPPDQPFLTSPPTPIRGNTSTSLSAFGRSQTRSTTRGTEKEQATNNAVNDLTTAWMQNPDLAQRDSRRLLKDVLARNPAADSKEVRQNLSNTLFETYHAAVLQNQPNLDPKTAFRQAYGAAAQDLGPGMFVPTDQMRTLATQVPSLEERRSLAVGQGDKTTQKELNIVEGERAGALQTYQNKADIYSKALAEGAISQIPGAVMGQTTADVAGRPALGTQDVANLRIIRSVIPQFKRMEALNAQIATSKAWKDLAGQKFDTIKARLLSLGDPDFVAKVNAYEDYRQLVAISYARAQGMVGTQTEMDRLVSQGVIPASGEFGPTAQKKWDFIFQDFQNRLEAFEPQSLAGTKKQLPNRLQFGTPPPPAPRLLTPEQQAIDAQLNRERPAP